jgi:uncharacterized SAM-binding protein YcdF (DUF218 family)
MFFFLSKALWYFATPLHSLLALAIIGVFLGRGEHRILGRRLAALSITSIVLLGTLPVGAWLIKPLEDRFPSPSGELAEPYGIIVLGGSIDPEIGRAHRQVSLPEGGARLIEGVSLSRRFPKARLVFSGGGELPAPQDFTEAHEARNLWTTLGVDPARIVLEDRSRNTDENARFTRDLVHPDPNEIWLLVTSAWHMPRSAGLFRKAGFRIVAYPVDYQTAGSASLWKINGQILSGLQLFHLAVHEWIGLAIYRLTGKIDEWVPSPLVADDLNGSNTVPAARETGG